MATLRFGSLAAYCCVCLKSVIAKVVSTDGVSHTDFSTRVAGWLREPLGLPQFKLQIKKLWPAPSPPRIPEHLDPRVERALLQAESNFRIRGNEEASGMMYRRALEVALDLRFPDVPGMLFPKIKALVKANLLLPEIGEWADHIRQLGNDAAHEAEGIERSDLEAMREFTDALLRYAISLPVEIQRRKDKTVDG